MDVNTIDVWASLTPPWRLTAVDARCLPPAATPAEEVTALTQVSLSPGMGLSPTTCPPSCCERHSGLLTAKASDGSRTILGWGCVRFWIGLAHFDRQRLSIANYDQISGHVTPSEAVAIKAGGQESPQPDQLEQLHLIWRLHEVTRCFSSD